MRYFYDCEFIEDGRTIELVSIGVVAEDGREFYAVSTEFDPERAGSWVRRHVLRQAAVAGVDKAWRSRREIRETLRLLRHRRRGPDRAVGLVRRLRPRGALPAVGGDARTCRGTIPRFTREMRQHWEAAGSPPIPGPGPATRTTRWPTPATTCCVAR